MTATAIKPWSWMSAAACDGEHPSVMFPAATDLQQRTADRICARCTVRAECLAYALDLNIEHGVWGGRTEDQRRAIRRLRKQEAASAT